MKNNIFTSLEKERRGWILFAIITAIIFIGISFIGSDISFSPLWLIPLSLIFFLLAIISIDKFLLLILFFTPLSVQMRFIFPDISADLFLPTELMLALVLFMVLFKALVTREMDRKIFRHPVTLIGLGMLVWCLVTSLTGTMPLVSLKSFLTRIWFFAGFYLLAAQIFKSRVNLERYFMAYLAGMLPVVIYFINNMWHSGLFNNKATFQAVRPFFNDHTAIGASLAFCIPVIIFLLFKRNTGFITRFLLMILLLSFSFAFVLSYSRAAWVSLAIAFFVVLLMALRISWKVILPAGATISIAIIFMWPYLSGKFYENRQTSSRNLSAHIQSISNITTDDSNKERINRWNSALRMSDERPLLGWGPATYQFIYAPYQIASEKTSISTNYGEGGNAHSEYLGALSDSGIPGMALFILLIATVLYRAFSIYYKSRNRESTGIILTLVAGLMTYVVHGALNNFLDTDKISALFWGMIAGLVAIDIEFSGNREELTQQ